MSRFPIFLTAACLASGPALASPPVSTPMQAETARNRQVVTAFFDLFYLQKQVRKAFETYVVPDYVQHNPIAADGRDAAIAALEPFFANQPAIHYDIKRIIVDGDLAAVHSFARYSPQDRGSAVVDIVRLRNGKVVEHWDVVQPMPEKSANPHPMF